jgi:hypothetical protein
MQVGRRGHGGARVTTGGEVRTDGYDDHVGAVDDLTSPDSDLDMLVDFEPGASLLDHVGLFQDLEELLGVGVDLVTRSALKPRDDHIRSGAMDL